MIGSHLERAEREMTRWRILFALYAGRGIALSEHLLLTVLCDIRLPATPASLRRELDYLEACKLLEIERAPHNTWLAELTALGIQVVEYSVDCPPGIARPPEH